MRRKLSHRGRPNVIRGALGVLLLALLGRSGTASPLAPSHGLSPRNNANVLTPSCPKYPVSKDGRCGKLFGYTKCPPGSCCSQWNYCSYSSSPDPAKEYCGSGCQLGYGGCTPAKSNSSSGWKMPDVFCRDPPASTGTWSLLTTSTPKPSPSTLPSCPNYPVSSNGRCGKLFGFAKCPSANVDGVEYEGCCSRWNYCWDPATEFGQRFSYCGIREGCQPGYGACDDSGQTTVPCRVDINPTSATPTYTYITVSKTKTPKPTKTKTNTDTLEPTGTGCPTSCISTVTVTVSPTITDLPSPTTDTIDTTETPNTETTETPTLTTNSDTATGTLTLPTDIGTSYVTATFKPDFSYPQSTDELCGVNNQGTRCGNETTPGCCGGDGRCYYPPQQATFNDTQIAFGSCGPGCQQNYGICWAAFIKIGQRCGPGVGSCPNNICCGASGYCEDDGATDGPGWCGCDCQKGFGKCFDGYGPEVCNTTTFTTLTATPTPTAVVLPDLAINTSTNARCGSEFGRCPNNLCCSAASFCENDGKTDGYAWCGCGCQFGYGRCFLYADGTCPTPTSTTGTLSVVPYTAVGARAVITRIVEEPEVKVGRLVREEERDKSGLAWLWERIAG